MKGRKDCVLSREPFIQRKECGKAQTVKGIENTLAQRQARMGCALSSKVEGEWTNLDQEGIVRVHKIFKRLYISEQLSRKLFRAFHKFDSDRSGLMSFGEFCDHFDLEENSYTKRAFMILDTHGSGQISFVQFVITLWNYCALDKEGLAKFTYMLYDVEKKGKISLDRMFELVESVYGFHTSFAANADGTLSTKRSTQNHDMIQAKRGIKKHAGTDGVISIHEFVKYSKTHPKMLEKPFGIQQKLQGKVGSKKDWNEILEKRRIQERKGGAVSLADTEKIVEWVELKIGSSSIMRYGPGVTKSTAALTKTEKILKEMDGARKIQKVMRGKLVRIRQKNGTLHPHRIRIDDEWEEWQEGRDRHLVYYNRITNEATTDLMRLPVEEFEKLTLRHQFKADQGIMESRQNEAAPDSAPLFGGGQTASDALPEGWKEFVDKKTGHCYYYNRFSKETTWDKPTHKAPDFWKLVNLPPSRSP